MPAKKIDWSYHRPSWNTCKKTQEFLAKAKVSTTTEVNAKKETLNAAEAIRLARTVSVVIGTKGKKIVRIDIKKDKPTDEEISSLIVGPSGNLRAPAIRKGKTLIVGFDEEMYANEIG